MLAPTYASAKNIDPNEAYGRLEAALKNSLGLIEGVQNETWRSVLEAKPNLESDALLDLCSTKMSRRKAYKALKPQRKDEGAFAALTIMMDYGAGVSSGEALDLLESPEGQQMLQRGYKLLGKHLAQEILR